MSTHTTHFCDYCNSDRDITWGHNDGDGHAVNYSEYPVGDGWAEFQKPYTDFSGRPSTYDVHICAHCLAEPEFDSARWGKVSEWDSESQQNIEKGRKHGEAFAWAEEHLSSPARFGRRGVRQVFGDVGYSFGPRMADGRFCTSDRVIERRAA